MNGNNLVLDTNIILYFLAGDKTLIPFFEDHSLHISVITEIELLGYKNLTEENRREIKNFLKFYRIFGISDSIKKHTIRLRKQHNMKLPVAIIMGTALALNCPLRSLISDLV